MPYESKPAWDSPDKLRADELVDLAEAWLADNKTSSRPNSYEFEVHVDADALRSDRPGAQCEVEGRAPSPPRPLEG